MDFVIYCLDIIGTAVFAISGALAAGRKRMDLFGVVVLGCVTALGGGTLRDMIIDSRPLFWIANTNYLAVAAAVAAGTFVFAQHRQLPAKLLLYADAVGLAVFTVIGFQKGFTATHSYSVAVVMGITTGVVGGIIRDLLANEIPLILRREIYASASFAGAVLLVLLHIIGMPRPLTVSAALMTTLAIRITAIHRNLALPRFKLEEEQETIH